MSDVKILCKRQHIFLNDEKVQTAQGFKN